MQAKNDIDITSTDGSFHNDSGNVLTADGIVNISTTSIKNDSTDTNNGYLQGNELHVVATSGDVENTGVMYSKTKGEVKAKNKVMNSQNIELGNGSSISATDKDVINTGLILGAKDLEISAADQISNSGEINVPELTMKTAKKVDNKAGAGISSSTKITMVNTPDINNAGLIDFGVMDATTGITSVTNSGTLKGATLSITAPTFNNTGRTELSGGTNLNVTSLTSNILTARGKSDIAINGNYTNTGKLYIDGSDLSITANSITNKSGAILKAKSFTATTKNGGTFTNDGIIFGKNGLSVTAPTINNSSTGYLVSGTTLSLTSSKTTNYGGISSAQNMTITGELDNKRDIRTQTELAITGAVANSGRLSGQSKVGITGNLTNSSTIESNNNITVASGSTVYNSGTMTSYGGMTLNNSSLTNTGVLQAVGTISSYQSGSITNNSSIYGGTVNLRTTGGSITNGARIIAKNNMYLQAAGDVINKDQIGLTGSGTLSISAGGDIRNDRKYQIVKVNTGSLHLYMPVAPSTQIRGGEVNRGSYHDQVLETIITTRTIYQDSSITVNSNKTLISSGGNIVLSASNLNNTTGSISARNNIIINGSNLVNADIVRQEYVYNQPQVQTFIKKRKWDWKGKGSWTTWGPSFRPAPSYFITNELARKPSLIQAGGSISGTLANKVALGSLHSGGGKSSISGPSGGGVSGSGNYSQVASEPTTISSSGASFTQSKSTSGARSLEAIDVKDSKFVLPKFESRQSLAELSKERMKIKKANPTTRSQLAKISMDSSSLSTLANAIADSYSTSSIPEAPELSWEFDDPEINKAIGNDWTKSKSSGRYYIKETSPVFTDMGTYFSTDNFINRIEGFEPKKQDVSSQTPKIHLGDSMKQMDFVRRQMIELTGHASLEDDVDYAQEIKNLYEKGIKYGKDMKLSAGVALSQEQVNALQDDMVWAEEIEIRGTKVIVPRLYVAKSKREEKASGLLARNISISAGSIENNGSSIIGENVVLKARDGDIVNTDDGDIYASNHLGLKASRDIINKGSSIASDGSGIITAGRNIENITSSKRYGDEKNHITKIGKQSTIKVRGPLALLSGGDLINKGSSIESGDLQFAVGGNMINESIEDSQSMETVFSGGHFKKKSVVYKPATITSTGTTKGFVAGDFALIGSRMSSTGDSEIKVGGNSMLISQVNSHMTDSHMEYTTSGFFSDNDHVQSHQSLTETLAGSTITAGGKNVLINKGDQILQGATFHGGKGTFLKGRKTSMLATALRNLKSDYEYDEGTIFNTTDSTGFDNTGHVHSSLSGGGEQIIDSDMVESDFTSKAKGSKSDKFFGSLFSDMLINKQNTPSEHQKPSWAKKLEASGKSIKWNPVTNSSKSWDEHSEVLNPQFSAVVSIAAALGTMYLGGFGMFGSAGATGGATATGATATAAATTASTVTNVSMLSTMGTAMGQAAITGIASRASVSMINNKFDLGKVMGDLTSKESIKGLGLNVLTAGLTAGIGHGIGLKELAPGMDMMQRTKIITQQALINGAVRTGLAGATGENIGQLWKEEALSGGLALTQSKIGDIGDKKELKTGSIGKVAMHSVTGAIYSAATGASPISGAIGGATSEIVAGIMESGSGLNGPPSDKPLTPEQAKINADKRIKLEGKIKATTKLLSATTTLLTGGSAKDITTAANVGESAVKYNRRLHPSEEQILAELQKGKTPEEQRKLELAAKFMVRASSSTSEKDSQKTPLTQDEIEGSKYVEEQQILRSTAQKRKVQFAPLKLREEMNLAEGLDGDPSKYTVRTFDYNALDWMSDSFSSNPYIDEGLYRFERAEEVLIGTIGSLTLKSASQIVGTMPFGLGDKTSSTLDGASTYLRDHALTNAFSMIETHKPTEGTIVQSSFKEKVDGSYVSEHIGSLVTMGFGAGGVIKSATKLAKIVPKAFKTGTVAKETVATEFVDTLSSSSLYKKDPSTKIGISQIDKAIKNNSVAKVEESVDSFFEGTRYSKKVILQMKDNDLHSFPESVKSFTNSGKISELIGNDGIVRTKLEIPGTYKGKKGNFEFIKEPDGTINHRFFQPNPK